MANGIDRNVIRLTMCVAAYKHRYSAWPTYAQLHPDVLGDIAHLLAADRFEEVAERIELRAHWPTDLRLGISVGGDSGVQWYEDVDIEALAARC